MRQRISSSVTFNYEATGGYGDRADLGGGIFAIAVGVQTSDTADVYLTNRESLCQLLACESQTSDAILLLYAFNSMRFDAINRAFSVN